MGSAAGVIVLVCTICSVWVDQNSLIKWWIAAAVLGAVTVALQMIHMHIDDRDFEELESRISDRRLSDSQKRVFKSKLAKFSGQRFAVNVLNIGGAEGRTFGEDIASILRECGWDGGVCIGFNSALIEMEPGIMLWRDSDNWIKIENDPNYWPEWKALQGVFQEIGIPCWGNGIRKFPDNRFVPPPKYIEIFIGNRP